MAQKTERFDEVASFLTATAREMQGSEPNEEYKEKLEEYAGKMLSAADGAGYSDITVCGDFDNAVRFAALIAEGGDAVLLSPACASFDAFSSFEERGNRFDEIVRSLS